MKKVVAGIIIKKGKPDSYLLVKSRNNFGEFTGFYYPPAGHMKPGESEIAALRREINEELGVRVVSAHKITDQIKSDIENHRTFWYFCELDSHDFTINEKEIAAAGFFTRQDMTFMKIWPATKELFSRYIFN